MACSHFGSYSCGSDIDRTLLLGRGRNNAIVYKSWENIRV